MGPGMVSNKMALFKNEFENFRILFYVLPNTKKTRFYLILIQDFQDLQGVPYGTVIKCKGDPAIFFKRIMVKSFYKKIELNIG